MNKDKVKKIIDLLEIAHPDAVCELNFRSNYELLVATVLSAQTTDIKVNEATVGLFEAASTPSEMVELGEVKIQRFIKTLGLSRSKSKYVFNLSIRLLEYYSGEVPNTMEDLTSLLGVGRKTANVVLSVGFSIPSMAVDTHVKRLANRIGFSRTDNVNIIEKDLKRQIPKSRWILSHHILIFHGRRVCDARNPKCEICTINHLCRYYKKP